MGKFKILYDQKQCIGAGTCASLSPKLWSVDHNNRAVLKGATPGKNGVLELVLDDTLMKQEEAVSKSCPSGCIRVQKL